MATTEHSPEAESTSAIAAFVRVVLVVAFTGIETVALVVWLGLVEGVPAASRAAALGLGVLVAGLVVEHVVTDLAVNGPSLSFPVGKIVVVSASEALLWALWLVIAERVAGLRGFLLAGGVLALLLVPQHTIEDNVLRGRGLFSRLFSLGSVEFSLVEAAGATVWLVLVVRAEQIQPLLVDVGLTGVDAATVGIGVLAATLLVEHTMGVVFSRRA